jgi:PEGA domain
MPDDRSWQPQSRDILCVVALVFASVAATYGQGNVFNHIRYNGGTFSTEVKPNETHNQLTVTSDRITFKLKDGQEIQILSKLVTSLSYGQEGNRLYFIGIQYSSPKGEKAGLLLQSDKHNYRAILQALQSVTNLPISVSESNRANMPLGLRTTLDNSGTAPPVAKSAAPQESAAQPTQYGNLVITSDPQDADVFIDGNFVGIAPATVDLVVGKHTIQVSSKGYADWSREITVLPRSKLTLAATLDKPK